MIRVLQSQGLAPLRPRSVPAMGDPLKQQAFFDATRDRIQHAGPDDHFLFVDACTLQQSATLTRMWGKRGHQPVVKVDEPAEVAYLYGALDVKEGIGHFFFTPKVNAEHFCSFLRHLAGKYGAGHLHIILDNAPAHRARKTLECADALAPYVDLNFLPPYSPMLNPIEKFWQYLRKQMTHNICFPSLLNLKFTIAKFLCQFTVPNMVLPSIYKIYYKQGPVSISAL
jgi:transposase